MAIRIDWQKPGLPLSVAAHVLVLLWGMIAFAQPSEFAAAEESVPVDVISESQLREITKGIKTAEKVIPNAPERADKVADVRKENDPGQAKTDTASVKPPSKQDATSKDDPAAAETPPVPQPPLRTASLPQPVTPPLPAPRPPAKPQSAADQTDPQDDREAEVIREQKRKEQQKAEEQRQADEKRKQDEARRQDDQRKEDARKAAEAKKQEEARQLAEKIKADEKKAVEEARKEEARKTAEAKKLADAKAKAVADAKKAAEDKKRQEAEQKEKDFDPDAIRKRLLASREAPTSSGATGAQVSRTASLGTQTGSGQKLSPSDREALVGIISDQIRRCWNLTVTSAPNVKPIVRLSLSPSGEITAQPVLTNTSGEPSFRSVADSGIRAIRQCAPYRIPARFASFHSDWEVLNVKLDPSDLL